MDRTSDMAFVPCAHCGGTGNCQRSIVVRQWTPYEYWHSFRECETCGRPTCRWSSYRRSCLTLHRVRWNSGVSRSAFRASRAQRT